MALASFNSALSCRRRSSLARAAIRGAAPLRDVAKERIIVLWFPCRVAYQMHQQLDGHARSVLADILFLVADRPAGAVQFGELLPFQFAALGRRQRGRPVDRGEFGGRVAGKLFVGAVTAAHAPVEITDGKGLGRVFQDVGQERPLLADFAEIPIAVVRRGFASGALIEMHDRAGQRAHGDEQTEPHGVAQTC